jgi:hypothetical protein
MNPVVPLQFAFLQLTCLFNVTLFIYRIGILNGATFWCSSPKLFLEDVLTARADDVCVATEQHTSSFSFVF